MALFKSIKHQAKRGSKPKRKRSLTRTLKRAPGRTIPRRNRRASRAYRKGYRQKRRGPLHASRGAARRQVRGKRARRAYRKGEREGRTLREAREAYRKAARFTEFDDPKERKSFLERSGGGRLFKALEKEVEGKSLDFSEGYPRLSEKRKARKGEKLPGASSPFGVKTAGSSPIMAAPGEIGRVAAEDPGAFVTNTLKGGKQILQGIPGALVATGVETVEGIKESGDPTRGVRHTAKAYAEDLDRRYGDLAEGEEGRKRFRTRIKEEGAAPELLDAAGAASVGGATAGRAITATVRAGSPRKSKAYKALAGERPGLRVSGNVVKAQELSPNAFKALGQRGRDKRRRTVHAKREARAAGSPAGEGRRALIQPGPNEVVRVRRRKARSEVHRDVAGISGRGLLTLKNRQTREVGGSSKVLVGKLNRGQQDAFHYVSTSIISPDPKRAIRDIDEHIAFIKRNRESEGVQRSTDQLPDLEELRKVAEKDAARPPDKRKVFNQRLVEAYKSEHGREARAVETDPGVAPERAEMRRYQPPATALGMERRQGPGPEEFNRREAARAQVPQTRRRVRAAEQRVTQARQVEGADGAVVARAADDELQAARKADGEARLEARRSENALTKQKGETPGEFIERVQAALEQRGRVQPLYFPSQERHTIFKGQHADYAPGGARAVAPPGKWEGILFRTGRQDIRPQVFMQGIARSVKRDVNWNLVGDTFARHVARIDPEDIKRIVGHADLHKLKPDELRRVVAELGIDPADVAFWNPGRFLALRRKEDDLDAEAPDTDVTHQGDPSLYSAVQHSAFSFEDLPTKLALTEFKQTDGWYIVPRAAYDEIMAATKPSGKVARSWEIVKGKQARFLLGSLNIPWLQFQVASNATLTGFAIGPKTLTGIGLPAEMIRAHVWWKKLSQKEREAIEPYIGQSSHAADVRQTKLGAAANNSFVNAYRAFKGSAFFHTGIFKGKGPSVSQMNPLDVLFRADNFQNNVFRRTVLYNKAKKEAYKRMGQNVGQAARLQEQITNILTLKDPKAQMVELLKDPQMLERHGEHVSKVLGDYTTYTAAERRSFQRAIMFYGYLRYSLKLVFYTLPVHHPVTASVLANMGNLQAQEIRELLGGKELPWVGGRFFYTKNGELESIDLSRANPVLNSITSMKSPEQTIGLLPPWISWVAGQFATKDLYLDRGFLTSNRTIKAEKFGDVNAGERGRILFNQALGLFYPARVIEEVRADGRPMGDDSLFFDQRPTGYVDPDILKSVEKNRSRRKHGVPMLLDEVFPLFRGQRDYSPEIAAEVAERKSERDERYKRGKKKKKKGSSFEKVDGSGGGGFEKVD